MKEGWTYKKLGEVCEILDSQRKPVTKKDRTKGIYPYYGASGIQDYVDSYIFDGRFLLVGEDGAKWGASDKSAFIIEGKSWVNNHAHILKISDSINDRLIEYYLTYKDLTEYISGAVVPKLTQKSLVSIPIPIPPIEEQERIVAELDLLQGIIEKKKEQLKAYDQLAQSIFYTMFGDPVENERKWDISELNNVCDVRDGTHDTPKYHEEGYPLITSKNVVDGRIIFDNVNFISKEDFDNISKRSRVDDGDIIMPMIGTIGKPTIVVKDRDFAIKNVALIKFVPNTRVLNIFIQSIMASSSFDTYMKSRNKGGTQKFIALGDIRKLKVPVPPLSLQQEFAEKVEAIERQKALVQQSIDETQTMFDCTMDKYFG